MASGAVAPWRVLCLSLEFVDPIFSGNGVLARAQVQALQGAGAQVMVICGCPEGRRLDGGAQAAEAARVRAVTVPTWYKLDRSSAWNEYGVGAAKFCDDVAEFKPDVVLCVDWTSTAALDTLRKLNALPNTPAVYFNFRVFCESSGISDEDRAFYRERETLAMELAQESVALCSYDAKALEALASPERPVLVLNPPLRPDMQAMALRQRRLRLNMARQLQLFRTSLGDAEAARLEDADFTAARTQSQSVDNPDALQHAGGSGGCGGHGRNGNGALFDAGKLPLQGAKTLPLRRRRTVEPAQASLTRGESFSSDFSTEQERVQHGFGGPRPVVLSYLKAQRYGIGVGLGAKRRYLTCCCRVCPEKNVGQFVAVVCRLSAFLKEHRITPCLVGPATDDAYANELYRQLDAVFPGNSSRVVPKFVPVEELSAIFQETLLNFHPALYEAFGMTMLEAAAFGAPTIMHAGGAIGAADVLPAPRCAFLADMTNPATCAAAVKSLLRPEGADLLSCVGLEASAAATSWDKEAYTARLFEVLETTVQNRFRSFGAGGHDGGAHNPRGELLPERQGEAGEGDEDEDEEIWMGLLQWIVSTQEAECAVINVALRTVADVARALLQLPPSDFARCVDAEWKRAVGLEQMSDGASGGRAEAKSRTKLKARAALETYRAAGFCTTAWAKFFMDEQRFPSVSKARYRLVPSRIPEYAFWSSVFGAIRRFVGLHLQPDPLVALQALALRFGAAAPATSGGISQEALARDALANTASRLCDCGLVLVLTGMPSVQGNPITAQKLDGPCVAAMLVRALLALGKVEGVRLVTERVNSYPLQASLGAVLGEQVHFRPSEQLASELTTYEVHNMVCVETFEAGMAFGEVQRARLAAIVDEFAQVADVDRASVACLSVERAAPAASGVCVGADGHPLPAAVLAPLHEVVSMVRGRVNTLAVASADATVVGRGAADTELVHPAAETVVGSQATLAGFALLAAVALAAAERGMCERTEAGLDRVMGTVELARQVLDAASAAGAWDEGASERTNTIAGVSVEAVLSSFEEMRMLVLRAWEAST